MAPLLTMSTCRATPGAAMDHQPADPAPADNPEAKAIAAKLIAVMAKNANGAGRQPKIFTEAEPDDVPP